MSRKDFIMALALGQKDDLKEPSPSNTATENNYETAKSPVTVKKAPNITVTDIKKIWSRPLEFKDFPSIFDHNNEHRNFITCARNINTALMIDQVPTTSKSVTHQNVYETRSSLLCYEAMPLDDCAFDLSDADYGSDDSVKDKDYVPKADKRKKTKKLKIFDTEGDTSANVQIVTVEIHNASSSSPQEFIKEPAVRSAEVAKTSAERTPELPSSNGKGLTKSGVPRKRRKPTIPLSERIKMKKVSDDEKLSIKPPCDEKCRRKCTSKINTEERHKIHSDYINLNFESRGIYIKSMVETYKPKVRKVLNEERKANRDMSHRYYFNVNDVKIEVCKKYFLTSLGYHANNNRRVYTALNKEIYEQKDKRGTYKRTEVIDKDILIAHIHTYNPTISHYRREHAPNKLYLPSDINITMMHKNFLEKYPNMTVSFEVYRKVVRDMNISFTHLGHEECEQCALYDIHKISSECTQEPCEKCLQYEKHKIRYRKTREEYKKDVDLSLTEEDHIYVSADLQKVIMLPRMDQYKSAIFCPRIIAFNESFVPLGKTKDNIVPYAVLWNETISGRRQEDIISTFRAFLLSKRDVKKVTIWTDNCAAQNKNWAFMCFLVNIVNSGLISTETITIKYFETGHTFMSADHFHHQVEKSMKNKKIHDYADFVDAVRASNSKKNQIKEMLIADFFYYEDVSSQHKLRNTEPRVYLRDITAVKSEKGKFTIAYQESHDGDWKNLDFLQAKIKKNQTFPEISRKESPRGITQKRKEEIILKLLPLMPENRRRFWNDLPVCNSEASLD